MEDRVTQSTGQARAIIRVTNPCILSVLVLLLIGYTKSSDMSALVGWVVILLLFLVVLPLVYVYVRSSTGKGGLKLVADPTIFLKHHPRDILILGVLSGLPCVVILVFLEAPLLLLYTLMALLAGSLVIALFNVFYKVSYHLAALTILITMAVVSWGQIFLVLFTAIPLIGWAKYRLREHTPTQLATAIALSVAISAATLYLLR